MNNIMRRRRALMANQWEDITDELSFYNWTGVEHLISGNDIRVYSTSDGSSRAIRANFTTSADYKYRFTCDSITVTNGVARICCRNSSGTVLISTSTPIWEQSQGAIEKEFNHLASIVMVSLFCTAGTSEAGDVTYHNFHVWRKRL